MITKTREINYFLAVIFILTLVCCNGKPKQEDINAKQNEKESIEKKITLDTLKTSFPIQIANDKGVINVINNTTVKNKELIKSDFTITLNGFKDYDVNKVVNKEAIIDNNTSVHYKDSITSDYLKQSVLKQVEFDFVRGNTLYFKAELVNLKAQKEITGRFNLFYTTSKKGKVYGWITDEVKPIK